MLSMISMEAALGEIQAIAETRVLKAESRPLQQAVGQVLAEPSIAALAIPPFRNSARDGFIVSADVLGSDESWPVIGEIRAGDTLEQAEDVKGPVARIMTGAPIPSWGVAVVMLEHVEVDNEHARFQQPIEAGSWMREQGSDIAAGQVILSAGRRLIAEHVQALASSGVTDVVVHRRPRVGVCSTGEELVALDSGIPGSGQIYDSNRPFMQAQMQAYGCDVVVSEHVGDTLDAMTGFLHRVMDESLDLVVSSGAVSMGRYDFVKPALEAVGAEIVFHKVMQKPGKPLLFAVLPNGTLYFGLPGNPVSTTANCRFYVHHALAVLQQKPMEKPLKLRLENDIEKPEGIAVILKARCVRAKDGLRVQALEGQESFQTKPLLDMNGWIVLSEHLGSMQAGDLVSFYPANPNGLPDIF